MLEERVQGHPQRPVEVPLLDGLTGQADALLVKARPYEDTLTEYASAVLPSTSGSTETTGLSNHVPLIATISSERDPNSLVSRVV